MMTVDRINHGPVQQRTLLKRNAASWKIRQNLDNYFSALPSDVQLDEINSGLLGLMAAHVQLRRQEGE